MPISVISNQSSAIPKNILDFKYVAFFWNYSASNITGVEDRGKYRTFHTCKIRRGVGAKCLSEFFKVTLGPKLWYTFTVAPLRSLGSKTKFKDSCKTLTSRLSPGGLTAYLLIMSILGLHRNAFRTVKQNVQIIERTDAAIDRLEADIKLFIHIHSHIHIHRCHPVYRGTGLGLHVGLCTAYPQSEDSFYYYMILTIAKSISIPYSVSK